MELPRFLDRLGTAIVDQNHVIAQVVGADGLVDRKTDIEKLVDQGMVAGSLAGQGGEDPAVRKGRRQQVLLRSDEVSLHGLQGLARERLFVLVGNADQQQEQALPGVGIPAIEAKLAAIGGILAETGQEHGHLVVGGPIEADLRHPSLFQFGLGAEDHRGLQEAVDRNVQVGFGPKTPRALAGPADPAVHQTMPSSAGRGKTGRPPSPIAAAISLRDWTASTRSMNKRTGRGTKVTRTLAALSPPRLTATASRRFTPPSNGTSASAETSNSPGGCSTCSARLARHNSRPPRRSANPGSGSPT